MQTAVMTLSSFRVAPRRGHLERVKRIYGYISKMKHGIIRIRVQEPDLYHVPVPEHDWEKSVYGNVKQLIPTDAPKPYGKFVTAVHYVDANLMHLSLIHISEPTRPY